LVEDEVTEIRVASGNTVSAGALASCGFWNIDVLICTRWGNPIAVVKSLLSDDSHVQTRIGQYEALTNGKGIEIAKELVLSKTRGQCELLKKYGLHQLDYIRCLEEVKAVQEEDLARARRKLLHIEGMFALQYLKQIMGLFNESYRPEGRKAYKAYNIVNNILNLGYSVLFWKIQLGVARAKLEPYLGFLHSLQFGKPSLICDFQEPYRFLIDDFAIQFCQTLNPKDFVLKNEDCLGKKGKREFLEDNKAREFVRLLDKRFEGKVSIPRIKHGTKQEIETLINEELLLFAKYLRGELPNWIPRVPELL
jgi:CRISP-associated protein Cas1